MKTKTNEKKPRKPYKKPAVQSEKVLDAAFAALCNGVSSSGGRKATGPCTHLKT